MWKIIGVLLLAGAGYFAYESHRAGYFSTPEMQTGEFPLSFESGLRGVMQGIVDERSTRNYLGLPARDVPSWFEDAWSVCSPPSTDERIALGSEVDMGPGARLEAVCFINVDGEEIFRGVIYSVPEL
ncbi:hypothetical protein A8B78_07040 [Jannaschia sp. EhC01]|nr:hypothetical protein A8B78_07040 [Jannaschia sp. EhC01]